MKTIKVIETAINQGLTNSEMDLLAENKNISFADYIGATNANGKYKTKDPIPAGLFIYGESNFISIPDTIFFTEMATKVAFYEL